MASRDYFKGKRIAVIGLGPNGEMIEDIKFMIKAGALVGVYDLRSEARLKTHLVFLRSIGLANYVCGVIPADDLLDMDLIVLSHEYPRQSSFLREAQARNIPIEYPETLLFKLIPPVTVIGIMGVSGKTTVISMLSPMLKSACAAIDGQGFSVVDSESGDGVIAALKKTKSGDIVLVRIVGSMMPELHALRISPHVAVFTSIPRKGDYVTNPFEILSYQTYNNFIVGSDEVIDNIHAEKLQSKAKMLRTKSSVVPTEWLPLNIGEHEREDAALALQTARLFKVTDEIAEMNLSRWKPLKGRLEMIKKIKNIEFFNDSASVNPYSTETAVRAVSNGKNLVLLFGGAEGGGDYRALYSLLPKHVHTIVLIPGSGTMRERRALGQIEDVTVHSAPSIEEAVRISLECARKGDRVLFSPGFEAVGIDASRKERGERFVRAVRAI